MVCRCLAGAPVIWFNKSSRAVWLLLSAAARCGAGCMRTPFDPGTTAVGYSRAIRTSPTRPAAYWIVGRSLADTEQALHDLFWSAHPGCAGEHSGHRGHSFAVGLASTATRTSQTASLTALKSLGRVRWTAKRTFWLTTSAGYSRKSSPLPVQTVALSGSSGAAFGGGALACGFREQAASNAAATMTRPMFFTGEPPRLTRAPIR